MAIFCSDSQNVYCFLLLINLIENSKAIFRSESQFPGCSKRRRCLKRLSIARLLIRCISELFVDGFADYRMMRAIYRIHMFDRDRCENELELGSSRH